MAEPLVMRFIFGPIAGSRSATAKPAVARPLGWLGRRSAPVCGPRDTWPAAPPPPIPRAGIWAGCGTLGDRGGSSSVGRALACGASGRGFEPRLPPLKPRVCPIRQKSAFLPVHPDNRRISPPTEDSARQICRCAKPLAMRDGLMAPPTAPSCGAGGRGFESHLPPLLSKCCSGKDR